MFTSNQTQRQEPRRPDAPNFVPDPPRPDRPENSRLRTLAQRIPRLNPIPTTSQNSADFRVFQWSESRNRGWDNDYVLRLPVLDLSRVNGNRVMNPAPVHTVNGEAVVNNPRALDEPDVD